MAMDGGSKSEIELKLRQFMQTYGGRPINPVLIISYETFRLYTHILHTSEIGLVLCDEVKGISFNYRIILLFLIRCVGSQIKKF